jgi:hypothetical protein
MAERSITAKQLQRIENHLMAAKHHKEASLHHLDIAKHLQVGDHDQALDSYVKAKEHSWYAQECEMKEQERHALIESYNKLISRLFI